MKVDFIIVGGGLSGSSLAYTLMKEGKSVVVIDDHLKSAASMVAAGLYNPIVFKRVVKSWEADILIPFLDTFYAEIENKFDVKFHYKKNILKVFVDENEIETWQKKFKDENLQGYLEDNIFLNDYNGKVSIQKGLTKIKQSGYIDLPLFIGALHKYFEKKNCFLNEAFDYEALKLTVDSVVYKDISADKIIFCEGHKATENPWFNYAKFKLTKGETLTINSDLNLKDEVLNKGVFLMPTKNEAEFVCGATYEWQDLSELPTEKGKNELTEKLEKLLLADYKITKHSVGIRPTVNDRRPVIGSHYEHKQLAIFNGMGTKGVMMVPYLAKKLAEHLLLNAPLDKEVDVNRFWKG